MSIPAKPSSFRPEIQALRAIAVIAVFLFHLSPRLLPGGFVGVDVFFVISGFLMTGILYREFTQTGTISLKTFYSRRIRRLLPASTLVLVFVGFTVFLLPSVKWLDTAKEILASGFYVQNWWLGELAVDYWAQDDMPTMLVHYWSLSIEEQYYIFWPILFLLLFTFIKPLRKQPKLAFLLLIVIICVSSFWFAQSFSPRRQMLAYYYTTTRVWELALGGILAVISQKLDQLPNNLKLGGSWLGIILIIIGCIFINSSVRFPGYAALIPTLGAMLVIMGGDAKSALSVRSTLNVKPVQYIGDISYSFYLWHWPVIILYRYLFLNQGKLDLRILDMLAVFAVTLFLSHLSKTFVEDAFRQKSKKFSFKVNPAVILFSSFFIIVSMALLITSVSYDKLKEDSGRAYKWLTADKTYEWAKQKPFDPALPLIPSIDTARRDFNTRTFKDSNGWECIIIKELENPAMQLVMVGDSHIWNWEPVFRSLSKARDDISYIMYTKGGAAFIDTQYYFDNHPDDIESIRWNEEMLEELRKAKPDVLFTSNYHLLQARNLKLDDDAIRKSADYYLKLWNELTAMGIKVVVISDTPQMKENPLRNLVTFDVDINKSATPRDQAFPKIDPFKIAQEKNTNPDILFWDFSDYFCDENMCPPVIGQVVIYRDNNHLTATFMRLLAEPFAKLFKTQLGIEINLSAGTD